MSAFSKTIAGLTLDEGAAFFVKESARAEEAAAVISQAQIQTSKFMGRDLRREFRVIQATALTYGLQATANHLPDIKLAYEQFCTAYHPREAIQHLDEMLTLFGGTVSAPSLRVIPGSTIGQSAYKSAEGMAGMMYGLYKYKGYWRAEESSIEKMPAPISLEQLREKTSGFSMSQVKYLSPTERTSLADLRDLYDLWNRLIVYGPEALDEQSLKRAFSVIGGLAQRSSPDTYQLAVNEFGLPYALGAENASLNDAVPDVKVPHNGRTANLRDLFNRHIKGGTVFDEVIVDPIIVPTEVVEIQRESVKSAQTALAGSEDGRDHADFENYSKDFRQISASGMKLKNGKRNAQTNKQRKEKWSDKNRYESVLSTSQGNRSNITKRTYDAFRTMASNDETLETVTRKIREGTHLYFKVRVGKAPPEVICIDRIEGESADEAMKRAAALAGKTFAWNLLRDSFARETEALIRLRNRATSAASLYPSLGERLSSEIVKLQNITGSVLASKFESIDLTELRDGSSDEVAKVMEAIRRALSEYAAEYIVIDRKAAQAPAKTALGEAGYTLLASGRFEPTQDRCVALVPIKGRGVTPVRFVLDNAENVFKPDHTDRLNVAVVLEEAPAVVSSPVRTMIMTSALKRLMMYFDGQASPSGMRFDRYSINKKSQYETSIAKGNPSPHAILDHQLARYAKALGMEIENATIDTIQPLLVKATKLMDAKIALEAFDDVLDAIIDRDDWVFMLQSLFLSGLLAMGKAGEDSHVYDSAGDRVGGIRAGVAPWDIVQFLAEEVMTDLYATSGYAKASSRAFHGARLTATPTALDQAEADRLVRGEVLLARVRSGWSLLVSLLDGSEPLCPTINAPGGSISRLVAADLALEITQAIGTMLERDYLGILDQAQFEAPWTLADWSSQFANFTFGVTRLPIYYRAYDLGSELANDVGSSAVANALLQTGMKWTEIAPELMKVSTSIETESVIPLGRSGRKSATMAGSDDPDDELFNDAPIAHQSLRLTTLIPMYDQEGYNMIKAYLTSCTSRTYFAQPIGRDVSDSLTVIPDPDTNKSIMAVLTRLMCLQPSEVKKVYLDGWEFEKCPALTQTALIVPYISSFLTKAALTRDEQIPELIEVDTGSSLAVTSGVTIVPARNTELISYGNGLAVNIRDKTSVSAALDWIGS